MSFSELAMTPGVCLDDMTSEDCTHWRRNQAAVTVAAFIGFTGFTLVMPFLPLYFGELGISDPGGRRHLVRA